MRERTVNGNIRQLADSFESSAAVLNAMRRTPCSSPDNFWETVGGRYQTMTAAQMD